VSLRSSARSFSSFLRSLNRLASGGRELWRIVDGLGLDRRRFFASSPDALRHDADVAALLDRASGARDARRTDEAAALYRKVLERDRGHLVALRALRDLGIAAGRWTEALATQERVVLAAPAADRVAESEWLAVIHYEIGREHMVASRVEAALAHFRQAVRADRRFVPAAVALGDAQEAAGDHREAVRTWERAAEVTPSLPLLGRLERVYRNEGRPSRMIALYRTAAERAPDDLALGAALGRVYFELEMLDEAADQFEKLEVRSPDLPAVHAFLGAVFERRGELREAFEEYRRALRLAQAFSWPHRCSACGAMAPTWQDRCPSCRRWNALRPADRP
jgi:lipopolysaccharide biosynthesis regulator YciM